MQDVGSLLQEIERGFGKIQNPKKSFHHRFKEFGRSTRIGDSLNKYKSRVHQLQQNFIVGLLLPLCLPLTHVLRLRRLHN
jgi:hypothetical protein